ncbi:hypothetical protein J421_1309 [Gemmatirosa kalamazoonensis]|uniref:Bacterial surface antigen (D15) domain-containing protein n=1 Tax=Gemmatirosa kalamazoonensis TaxID=861299 RepID=W0RDH8_9BACT|nr:hypothetical protein [Gemmatirosa kalamazoonensis]AHG88846.1 hypothetical protein J421_1309 [Gemmatirosa kalamazoonensis]
MARRERRLTLTALGAALLGFPLGAGAQRDTATYASEALRALVAAAARDNRVPASLGSYRAAVESEMAVALRTDDGVEAVISMEQVASTLRWTRTGFYDQHVVGYRARQAVPTTSAFALLPSGWVVPVLYGERLFPPRPPADSVRRRAPRPRRSPSFAVHPLAGDRERWYRFSGGDTVVTLRVPDGADGTRAVPIVRVHVEPRAAPPPNGSLFLGDVELDAVRHVVVRMRGQYLAADEAAPKGIGGRLRHAAMQGYAFIEYETAERDGRYWLPTYQRLEFQILIPALGESRAVLRIVSRLRDVTVNDTTLPRTAPNAIADADTARPARWWRLTRAKGDTLDRFDRWREALGTLTGATHADDFDDVAPDAWRRVGPPRVEPYVARGSDLLRFDRVQGLFTGSGVRVRFRDAAPGLTLRAVGGWAWAESTARGRVELERELGLRRGTAPDTSGGRWALGLRVARSLDITNDFRNPLDSGSSAGALLGSEDLYDYVDRRTATAFVRRTFAGRAAVARLEVGAASDRGAATHVRQGIVAASAPFRPNRGVDAGNYARTALTLDLHPDVSAEFVRPGVGARLSYERGDGGLTYQRAELRVVGRAELDAPWGRALRGSTLTLIGRGEGGVVVAGEPPPQQLFEVGGDMSLQAYDYKTFAGDRAGVVRGVLQYGSPWWHRPLHLGPVVLPGVSPGLSAGLEAGAVAASTAGARRAIERLGPRDDAGALSRPSDGVRTTMDLGMRFFGGALFVGASRALDAHRDRPRGWQRVIAVGAEM